MRTGCCVAHYIKPVLSSNCSLGRVHPLSEGMMQVSTWSFSLSLLLLAVAPDVLTIPCGDDCADSDVEVAGPSLSLGCNRTAFAVDLSDWTTDGVPMINSLFIECSNEFNTTCVDVAAEDGWPINKKLGLSKYQFPKLNTISLDTAHNCTVFGCYERTSRREVYKFANSSCSLPGIEDTVEFVTTTEYIETLATESTETVASNPTKVLGPVTKARGDSAGSLPMMVVMIPVALLVFSVSVFACFALFRARRSVSKKSRRHYDFGVHDLVTDSADTGVQWLDMALKKSEVSESVLTLFQHLNDSRPPEYHSWITELHPLKRAADSNNNNDLSSFPCQASGEKLYMDSVTLDRELMCDLEKDRKQGSGVCFDRCCRAEAIGSPYSGYCTTSKSIPRSPTSKSFDLSIDLNVSTFDSRQEDLNHESSGSTCDLADFPHQSTDVDSTQSSYLECKTPCDVPQEVESSTSGVVQLDVAADLKVGGIEQEPQKQLLPVPEYMTSEGLGNSTKEDRGFRNPIAMNFDLVSELEDENFLSEEFPAKNLDFKAVIFNDEDYMYD